ncbi:MAG: thiamine-phosphate kinase, partial [Pyrinomonadaceae bacterium]
MKSEFDFIQHIKKKYSLNFIGDDCAVLPKDPETDMVVTADLLVEDIDFRLDWTTPELLGHKALAVSLSDIAAMGAEATWAMLSIGVPKKIWNGMFVDQLYEGWFTLSKEFSVELVGGDVSRTPEKIVIDSIVGGEVRKGAAVTRSTAGAGDSIFVSGELGGAAAGLELLEQGRRLEPAKPGPECQLILKQLKPVPRLREAELLRNNSIASAMIDLSDGLSSDLQHLVNASGVGARIYYDAIPIDEIIFLTFDSQAVFEMAINGGEDFE